jgi:glycerol-3-phosphate dehydrogenase
MVCAFSEAEEATLRELYEQGQQNKIPGLQLLSGEEARKLEPYLSPAVTKVLRVTNAGIISPYELTVAAVGNAMDNGVQLQRNFRLAAICREESGFTVTSEKGETLRGKFLVNCAGGESDKIAALAGDGCFTIIPRAGEYMLLDKTEGFRATHTLFQCPTQEGKGILVTPTVHGNLLVGPTAAKVAAAHSRDTTPEGLQQVTRLAAKTVPSVNFRQVIISFTGVRASEKTGDFIIKHSETVPGLIHAAAIDSPGLTCCVSIADRLINLLQQAGLTLTEKKNWDGSRKGITPFRELPTEEKTALIRKEPAFGKVVCRCEEITEGEILQAIRQNPGATDLDGIKRRTRSGMGRCQGGFCSPYIMQLLSRELGIPMEQVTKSGEGSQMLQGRIGGQ